MKTCRSKKGKKIDEKKPRLGEGGEKEKVMVCKLERMTYMQWQISNCLGNAFVKRVEMAGNHSNSTKPDWPGP